jgi:hypothetical protein
MNNARITATAARKAAKVLGNDHPAVIHWRNVAGQRVSQINRIDANPRNIANTNILGGSLEAAKAAMVAAMS